MRRLALLVPLLLGPVVFSCNGTTGDQLITFSAYASGVQGAAQPFTAGNFTIQLTAARMFLGAVYFNEAPPGGSGFDGAVCIASGVFAAQVPGPVTVDLLSTTPQEFSVYGSGTADTALSWQVWLTDGDVNEVNFTPIVQVEGTATDASGNATSFGAVVTINLVNRSTGSTDPNQPGLNPLCRDRIVQIPTTLPFFQGGSLYVTIDPRVWFTQQSEYIDFSDGKLPQITDPDCNTDYDVFTNAQSYALAPETPPPAGQTCGGASQPCCTGDICNGPWTCSSGTCGPAVCIPNSSLLEGTVPGSTAGNDFFGKVISASPFSVSYAAGPP
jgi:hypothetical protein